MPKPSLEIWDIEITFGWSVMEALISLFEWPTSISKCKCSHLDGQLVYPNVNAVIWMANLYIQICKCSHLDGQLVYPNGQCCLNGSNGSVPRLPGTQSVHTWFLLT